VNSDLEQQVRAGAKPGAPDPADQISWVEDLAYFHGDL
jgi:hypothetical protein